MKVSFVRRVRTMNASDAPGAAALLLRAYPFMARFEGLPEHLARLLAEDMLHGVVVDYIRDGEAEPEIAAFGLSAFIRDRYVEAYLASPAPCFELTLIAHALRGEPVFLASGEIAENAAGRGLTLFPMVWLQHTTDPADPEAHILFGLREKTFWERHRGYRLARIIKEVPGDLEKPFLDGGFRVHCRFSAGTPLEFFPGVALERDTIMFTITRAEVEAQWPPSIVGQLFAFQEPRCGFSRSEQQVLIRAADGLTDARIAESLGISPTAVSLRWRSIYGRIEEFVRALLPLEGEETNGARGQEKRRTVVAFVKEHPEELRPFARPRATAMAVASTGRRLRE